MENFRIGKKEVQQSLEIRSVEKEQPSPTSLNKELQRRDSERKKMSMLRQKLSQRLVAVKNETAMLTTFNEVNMSRVLSLKNRYSDKFKEKYGISLGLMSFFTKAATLALEAYPQVNSMIDGNELITYKYADVCIAVSTPKGLMAPVIRNAESLSLAEMEIKIKELATKARDGKITLEELTGGTFTITNGGVFGSLFSTPIINPPQSAILGMHNIVERPIAINGKVEIAPMMYVALSYDHRVIDGRESVSFLIKVKELVEDPLKMLFPGGDPEKVLLNLL
jgi:2-oxoglutarate dehydrogenase E2 component (dihydrolipoamide succinyltransferase)